MCIGLLCWLDLEDKGESEWLDVSDVVLLEWLEEWLLVYFGKVICLVYFVNFDLVLIFVGLLFWLLL